MSMDMLITKIKEKNNPTVAGLDPKLDFLPQHILDNAVSEYGKTLEAAGAAIYEFNKGLIDALCDVVPAVKPQSAYYEMYGIPGIIALKNTIDYAHSKGLYVILDVKRNDIGSTAEAYSTAYLGKTDVFGEKISAISSDSITVNGYLGSDGIIPFIEDCNRYSKSIFTLVKTSNPSSGELQDLIIDGEPVYKKMAELVTKWGEASMGTMGFSNIGCVIGATYKEQLGELRKLMPHTYFLVPGYGAQGAGATDAANAFNKNGLGAIINSSRAIMCAYKKVGADGHSYAEAARDEAIKMKKDLNSVI